MIRELILQMKLGRLDRGYFKGKFSIDVVERYAAPFEKLRKAGHLNVSDDEIVLARESLLKVDELLHEFFLPQHKNVRYT